MAKPALKLFIFAARNPKMTHIEIKAASAADAIRHLVAMHGAQPYRIVNICSL